MTWNWAPIPRSTGARWRDTVIRGSWAPSIDSVCQIGHNVQMGEDCMMLRHGRRGRISPVIGNRVLLAGKSAVNDNLFFVGDDVIVGGAARVFTKRARRPGGAGETRQPRSKPLEIRKALPPASAAGPQPWPNCKRRFSSQEQGVACAA